MSKEHKGLVIFANQLVPLPELAKVLPDGGKGFDVFMAEDVNFVATISTTSKSWC